MKRAINGMLFAFLIPWSLFAQQAPERWNEWKSVVLTSADGLELREVLINDYDAIGNPSRQRSISPWMAMRSMSGAGKSLPNGINIESLPTLFFELPWDFSRTRRIEQTRLPGAVGIEMFSEGGRKARGELWFDKGSGALIESSLSFDGKELPRITVHYASEGVVRMTIRTVSEPGLMSAGYRDATFVY